VHQIEENVDQKLEDVATELVDMKHNVTEKVVSTMDLVNNTITETVVAIDKQIEQFNKSVHEKKDKVQAKIDHIHEDLSESVKVWNRTANRMIDNVEDIRSMDSYEEKAALIADLRDVPEPQAKNMERIGKAFDILEVVAPEVNPIEYMLKAVVNEMKEIEQASEEEVEQMIEEQQE